MLRELLDQFLPGAETIRTLVLPFLIIALLAATLAGWMKVKNGIRTPYTRKTFHFLIFSIAGLVQYSYGLHAATLYGIVVFILVMVAVALGRRWWFYTALARETDAPYEKRFIILPLLATATGAVLSNIFFPGTAYIGYFVGGWGDAIGEPVGTKWGKHRYTVPTLFGVSATRSIEGSAAVMLVSTAIATACIIQLTDLNLATSLLYGAICGLAAALVEAISSHGLDNLTIQLCASGVLHYFLFYQFQ